MMPHACSRMCARGLVAKQWPNVSCVPPVGDRRAPTPHECFAAGGCSCATVSRSLQPTTTRTNPARLCELSLGSHLLGNLLGLVPSTSEARSRSFEIETRRRREMSNCTVAAPAGWQHGRTKARPT